jgi:hypothetical protein
MNVEVGKGNVESERRWRGVGWDKRLENIDPSESRWIKAVWRWQTSLRDECGVWWVGVLKAPTTVRASLRDGSAGVASEAKSAGLADGLESRVIKVNPSKSK